MNEKRYTIKAAAEALNLSEVYIRRMIHQKKLQTVKVAVNESVWRHEIAESELNKWRKSTSTRTTREDGRNKYTLYANEAEFAQIQKLIASAKIGAIVERANKPEDVKKRYARAKARKLAAKAATK